MARLMKFDKITQRVKFHNKNTREFVTKTFYTANALTKYQLANRHMVIVRIDVLYSSFDEYMKQEKAN